MSNLKETEFSVKILCVFVAEVFHISHVSTHQYFNMRVAVYWAVIFTVLLILPEKTFGRNCYEPFDSQCIRGCYHEHDVCYECTNCTRDQLVDITAYHASECTSFPALCRRQLYSVNWRDYATDFHPINLPPLKGSFMGSYNQWLLIFFQEGSSATIGKLCLNEAQKIPTEWFTFQKSQLKCTGQGGIVYSFLVAVKNHSYNTSLHLALMTSPVENKSAFCLYMFPEIRGVFTSGKFYDPTVTRGWEAFPSDHIPNGDQTIGVCSENSQWTDSQKNFIRTHPLMYDNVTASQVLVEKDGLFTTLESTEKKGRDGVKHIIVFIGTDNGRILKYVLIGLDTPPNFLEEIYFTENASVGIDKLEIGGSPLKLQIGTTNAAEPFEEPLQRCSDMKTQCICQQDPYCFWNDDDGSCRIFDWSVTSKAQPEITKRACEGIVPGSALLVTNKHGRHIKSDSTTAGPLTTDKETGKGNQPKLDPPEREETVAGQPSLGRDIVILCVVVGVVASAIPVILFVFYYSNRNFKHGTTIDYKDWTSGWTNITFNGKIPSMRLCDATDGETEYTGKTERKKTIFEDLKPLTEYEACVPDERSPFKVSTKGPSFTDWVTTKDTATLKAGDCQPHYKSHLVLKCDRGFSYRERLEEGSVMFSRLTPNMKHEAWLEVCKKHSEEVITKYIKDVTTEEESFCVKDVDGRPCLVWSNLSSGIERYIQSCSCGKFEDFLNGFQSLVSGSKELPPLPENGKFTLKVMAKLQREDGGELEHTLASVVHETTPIKLVKLSEPSSPVQFRITEESMGSSMTTQEPVNSADPSPRMQSLPLFQPANTYQEPRDDSSTRLRSEPILVPQEAATTVSRQTSEGNPSVTFVTANNSTVILNSQVYLNTGLSLSSGIGSSIGSQSDFVELPYKGCGIQIGAECYQCSTTLLCLTSGPLQSEVRHKLKQKVFLSKETVIPCLCEVLKCSRDEEALHMQEITLPDRSLNPISEKEGHAEQISIVTLLYKLMMVLKSNLENLPEESRKKMSHLYSVINYLATEIHGDCQACNKILESVNHLWKCGGYQEDVDKTS